jgi:hypothetical protein
MSNKFLNTIGSNSNLTNGSADLYVNTLGLAGIPQTGKPLTLSASKHIQAGNISISDVTNLQNDLSIKNELSYTKSDVHSNPPAGQVKTYFKTDGNFYKKDEAGVESKVAGSGTGDVVGPNSSVDNSIPRFDSTTGKIIQGSGVTIDDSNNITTNGYIAATSGGITGTLSTNTVQPITTNTFDLGATTLRYNNIYGNNFVNALGSNIDVSSEVSSNAVNQIVTFSGTNTTGKVIKNSGVTIDASNNITGSNNITTTGLTTTQNLDVNNQINSGNINNVGTITTQGVRFVADNAVDIGEVAKQCKDLYIKGDIKYNKPTQNIFLGIDSGGSSLSSGNNNIAIGKNSLSSVTSGTYNVCLSEIAGRDINTGLSNVLLGYNSGSTINSGGGNICIGSSSGQNLTTGNNNVHIGTTSVGASGLNNSIILGSGVTNGDNNSCVIGDNNIINIRPSSQRGCDLGTTSRNYKDIYGDKVILHTQAQSDKYYNKNGTAGIQIGNSTAGDVTLTGSDYSGGFANRVFTVSNTGRIQLSNAILDNTGNLTASNTTLDSLTLKNNLNFDLDNAHDVGTVLTSARSVYYKTNLSGNTATFSGQINTSNILPITNNASDLGSNTLKYKDLYLAGTMNAVNSTTTNLTVQATGSANFQASPLNNTGTITPAADNTQDIGSTSLTYKNIYITGDVFKNGTISSKNSLVFPIADAVVSKQSILFTSPSVITEKSIMAQLDNPADIEQVYTFGQSIPNRWVTVGIGTNSIAYSSDGITWTGLGTSIFSTGGYNVAWNGTRWVAVGQGTNTIAYSSDGITWTGIGSAIFSTMGRGVAWNGTRWVAVGQGTNSIAYSADGITWTGLGTSIFSTMGFGVAWNGTRWVAVGEGTNSIAYSADGLVWTGIGSAIFSARGLDVAWNGTRWVAVGVGTNGIAYSANGLVWTGLGTSIFSTGGLGVAWNGTRFVALGQGATNTIAYSANGITWAGLGKSIFSTIGRGVAWNGTRWVAMGDGPNTIAYSADGLVWTGLGATIFSTSGFDVAWNSDRPNRIVFPANRTIAVGEGTNTIAYSADGLVWTGLGSAIFSTRGLAVAWNGTRWVAVGIGTNSIAYSSDGLVWTGLGATIFSTSGLGVAWNGTRWVAVGIGTNSIAYSADGITWTGLGTTIFSTRGLGVAWNGTRWVAVGEGTNSIAYSTDGLVWTGLGTSIFSTIGFGVAWSGTRFVAVGEGTNTIAYSADGLVWTGLGATIFSIHGRGVAWNGSLWVAVGEGTNTIAYSADGLVWTGLGTTIFSTRGRGVAWNGGRGGVDMTTITLDEYGVGLSNRLDVVNDKYYNQGFQEMTLSISV